MLKLNNFKGFLLFNEEDLDLMKGNYANLLEVLKNDSFHERDKNEVLENIKKLDKEINIGFFL